MAITGAGGIQKEARVGWVRATSEPALERLPSRGADAATQEAARPVSIES